MTQLELLAARVRGADSNAAGGVIIAEWYLLQTRSAANLARESAKILRDDAVKFDPPYGDFLGKIAGNFESVVEMLGNDDKSNVNEVTE